MVRSLAVEILIKDFVISKIRVNAAIVCSPIDLGVLFLQDFWDVIGGLPCCYVSKGDCLRLNLELGIGLRVSHLGVVIKFCLDFFGHPARIVRRSDSSSPCGWRA